MDFAFRYLGLKTKDDVSEARRKNALSRRTLRKGFASVRGKDFTGQIQGPRDFSPSPTYDDLERDCRRLCRERDDARDLAGFWESEAKNAQEAAKQTQYWHARADHCSQELCTVSKERDELWSQLRDARADRRRDAATFQAEKAAAQRTFEQNDSDRQHRIQEGVVQLRAEQAVSAQLRKELASASDTIVELRGNVSRLEAAAASLEEDLGDARAFSDLALRRASPVGDVGASGSSAVPQRKPVMSTDGQAFQQERAFANLAGMTWSPDSAAEIAQKLHAVYQSLGNWCKTYALPSGQTLDVASMPLHGLESLRSVLEGITASDIKDSLSLFRAGGLGGKAPSLVLLSYSTNVVYARLFDNAFAYAGDEAGSLEEAYQQRVRVNPQEGEEWRVQKARQLDPDIASAREPGEYTANSAARSARLAVAEAVADTIIADKAAILLRPVESDEMPKRRTQLLAILVRAAHVAYRLWTQDAGVTVMRFSDLCGPDGHIHFTNGNALLEHHALHNRQVDERESSLDGCRVGLLVHPVVCARAVLGKSVKSASGPVWKKAVAWLEV